MDPIWSHTVSRTGGTCLVVLAGELDMSAVDEVSRLLLGEVRRPGTESVIVDLDRLQFIDASGISALVVGHNAARICGRDFAVTRVHGRVRRVLELTGLLTFLSTPALPLAAGNGSPRRQAG